MRIAILSGNGKLYSTRRLKEACQARGHKVRVLDTLEFSIVVEQENPKLFYRGKEVPRFDAVIPRVSAGVNFFGTAVVRQFEQMGVFCLNSANAIMASRDKLRAIQQLCRHQIGIPQTAFVRQKVDVPGAIRQVGGSPVVLKLLEGTQGIGVMLASDEKMAEAIVETLHSARQNVLIQHFVEESRGRDIRAFVVGNRVVAAMRRIARGEEFRSNVHRGGMVEMVQLDSVYETTAIRAAQVMGLRVAGVDMLESYEGPKVMEVNSSPGLEGIEAATGVDVAAEVIKHIEEEVQFPDIDLRQRLTLRKGYAVIDVPVDERSELAHRTLSQARLRERDVQVLTITRGSVVIPTPHESMEILPGDVLLCFGKTFALKGIAAPPRATKKKKKRRDPDQLAATGGPRAAPSRKIARAR